MSLSRETETRLLWRIRGVLLKAGEPMKKRDLQIATSSRAWSAIDFSGALKTLAQDQIVVIDDDAMIELLDTTAPPPRQKQIVTKKDAMDRSAIWEKTRGRCWLCGRETNPFRDFRVTSVSGLPSEDSSFADLIPCCEGCDYIKADKTITDLRRVYPAGHRFFFEQDA